MTFTTEWLESVGCKFLETSYWAFDVDGCAVAFVTEDTFLMPSHRRRFEFVRGPYRVPVRPGVFTLKDKPRFRVKAPSVKESAP